MRPSVIFLSTFRSIGIAPASTCSAAVLVVLKHLVIAKSSTFSDDVRHFSCARPPETVAVRDESLDPSFVQFKKIQFYSPSFSIEGVLL